MTISEKRLSGAARFWIATALVAIGVLGRILPHAWNFAPVVAIGLFAGARLGKVYGLAVPAADILREFIMWDGDDQPGEAGAEGTAAPNLSATEEPDGQPTTARGQ